MLAQIAAALWKYLEMCQKKMTGTTTTRERDKLLQKILITMIEMRFLRKSVVQNRLH